MKTKTQHTKTMGCSEGIIQMEIYSSNANIKKEESYQIINFTLKELKKSKLNSKLGTGRK